MFYILPLLIVIIVNSCICDERLSKPKPSPTPFQDWDYIVYSQRWPITGCTQWKERSPKNTCNLPENNNTWIVHGLWPTKIGAKGPYFCNSAIHFDPDQLDPIMKELQEYWPNIEANTKPTSFWKHEWNKHGTCASTLPQLNSVTNYFKQALQWNQDYDLSHMLAKNEIVPDVQGYNLTDIVKAIQLSTNKNPAVQCVVDSKTKQSLISEIYICFNKSLDLIDCNITNLKWMLQDGDILSNCNKKNNVMYFASMPTKSSIELEGMFTHTIKSSVGGCLEDSFYEDTLLKFYSIIKFLIWFTL